MFEDYRENEEKNKSILAMIIDMVVADQKVTENEKNYIFHVGRKLGFSEHTVAELCNTPQEITPIIPSDERERMIILYYLLFTMRVDKSIAASEELFCFRAGLRLGFNHLMVHDLIQIMKEYLDRDIPPDAMMNEVKKYLN